MATLQEALAAAQALPLERLMRAAAELRDAAHRHITFSPKVFIPLTRLCRDRYGCKWQAMVLEFAVECCMGRSDGPSGRDHPSMLAGESACTHPPSAAALALQLWLLHICHAAGTGATSVHDPG